MESNLNLEEIRKRYEYYFQKAMINRDYTLPCYEIQYWDQVLNPVAKRVFEDIRCMGLSLYPYYPISGYGFIPFANPFIKVGLEIIYKHTDVEVLKRKVSFLESVGWEMYLTKSQKSYYTFNEHCDFKLKPKTYDDLSEEEQDEFLIANKDANTGCLLTYIRNLYFNDYYFGISNDELISMEDVMLSRLSSDRDSKF